MASLCKPQTRPDRSPLTTPPRHSVAAPPVDGEWMDKTHDLRRASDASDAEFRRRAQTDALELFVNTNRPTKNAQPDAHAGEKTVETGRGAESGRERCREELFCDGVCPRSPVWAAEVIVWSHHGHALTPPSPEISPPSTGSSLTRDRHPRFSGTLCQKKRR